MRPAESLILELAEYLKGNRGDPDGYFASFFRKHTSDPNVFADIRSYPSDNITIHHEIIMWELVDRKIHYTDPRKKRIYNFWGDCA